MPPDSTATKQRLLEAAFEEFARHGLVGARVDRIAEAAQANKRLIYVYYGNKEGLFDAVLDKRLGVLADAVPFAADDLSDYASALFDYLFANPKLLRLYTWRRLERSDVIEAEMSAYRPKVEAIAGAQRRGAVAADVAPADLLMIVLAMTTAWLGSANSLCELAAEGAGEQAAVVRHRGALAEAVRAVTRPKSKG